MLVNSYVLSITYNNIGFLAAPLDGMDVFIKSFYHNSQVTVSFSVSKALKVIV